MPALQRFLATRLEDEFMHLKTGLLPPRRQERQGKLFQNITFSMDGSSGAFVMSRFSANRFCISWRLGGEQIQLFRFARGCAAS
jgi:hypothetical protein